MEYISIIAIVVGFIFSMLQKEKKSSPKNKTNQQKPFSLPEDEVFTEKNIYENTEEIVDTVETELEQIKKEKALLEKKLKSIELYNKKMTKDTFNSKKSGDGLFSKDKLIDAVILSEVISPPRAKNGHKINGSVKR
ncbi:hypothetical protein [Niallia sp. 01092]|uniref:hypothetical protein n=1 Tax=unclassified Niallia TaxID=2837522 RepID=UPI003FD1AA4B